MEKYEVISEQPLKVVLTENSNVEKVMRILKENQIDVLDLRHEDADLEDSVLKLIAK